MSDSSDVGFVSLNSNMFFTCSSGITPAKICPTQNNHKTKENYSYLVKDDTATQSIGDFSCRWTLVLAAAIAAAGVVTGGAALLVLAAVAIAASMTLCGGLMAPMRKWVGYSTLNAYGKTDAYSLTSKCQMVCPIGGVIMFAPGITGFWSAAVYASRNAGMAVLEGVVIGAFCKTGLGGIASGLKGLASTQALANIAFISAFGAVDQVIFEGIVREGKRDSSLLENAGQGASWMAQPFINTAKRISSGYYSGGYAKDAEGNDIPEAHNGHGVGAAITDGYFDVLTLGTLGLLGKHSSDGISYREEAIKAANNFIEKGVKSGKKYLFERGKVILSKGDRLRIFMKNLEDSPGARTQEEALELINRTLDEVEDKHSGVKKADGIPDRDDGRMYGILDDKYVKVLEDGTKVAYTKGNRIILKKDGGFEIQTKDGSKTLFSKPGANK